ncbi:erythrocyte membrane protein 1, EMP1 [Plasmodium reichenowi]|uniref:Erythrocyte membrane protein 1, EMP1 n=1 Tax=Plasmodium reichenowi TaxID=5854 RepID=A0A060S1I4_PLARE|nr:erythrocyte membrane protein 1, EMP1 [Plasmodium reichenowi]
MVTSPITKIGKYSIVSDAKDLLDRIGEGIYKKAKEDAGKYFDELHGKLPDATYPNDPQPVGSTPNNPCQLQYDKHTNVTKGHNKEYPCRNEMEKAERFSHTKGAECDYRKIRDNEKKSNYGACAPFRRLSLCVRNLEHIDATKITTHNLLVDVCQAAKIEGESIRGYYAKYDQQYPGSVSTMCTMLARSFADIGDIIRGKDLYRGDNKENDRLQEQLKKYFKKIYEQLKNKDGAKTRYGGDEPHFYKLREDWWEHNRENVWKAITCAAGGGTYFRRTCGSGENRTPTQDNCRCIGGEVPTYFDYVPQYLRWLHEWAEDFCRKRKKKLQDAIKNCRGEDGSGKEKYCDLNKYDCKKTASGKHDFVKGENCNECYYTCIPFGPWIDNQKEEFIKQKEKYEKEMKKYTNGTNGISRIIRKRRSIASEGYQGYDVDFYNELKEQYSNVDDFLKKLSKEGICESAPHIGNETADPADFTKENWNKTFNHTTYCQACPWCGVDCKSGTCTRNLDTSCQEQIPEKKYDSTNTTDIDVLTGDKTKSDMVQKYRTFCANGANVVDSKIEKWQCHYDDKGNDNKEDDSNNCIIGKWQDFTGKQNVTSYDVFFYRSFTEMLDDSVDWKTQLKKCIDKANAGKCESKCRNKCECYKKWITQKKDEFNKIKDHFRKQKDIDSGYHDITFKYNLKDNFLEDMKNANGDEKAIKRIEELLEKHEKEPEYESTMKTIIEYMFDDALQEIEACLRTHKEKCPEDTAGARILQPTPRSEEDPEAVGDNGHHSDESDDDGSGDENEQSDDEVEAEASEEAETPEEPSQVPQSDVDVCDIVNTILTKDKDALQKACQQKYQYGKERFPNWKCIPTGNTSNTTSESGVRGRRVTREVVRVQTTPSSNGAICIPPRRRKLYVGRLTQWAESQGKGGDTVSDGGSKDGEAVSGESTGDSTGQITSEGSDKSTQASTPSGSHRDPLLTAFVESAAIETFFLWHQYKQLNTPQVEGALGVEGGTSYSDSSGGLFDTFSTRGSGMQAAPTLSLTDSNGRPGPIPPGLPPIQAQPTQQGLIGRDGFPGPFMRSDGPSSWTGGHGLSHLGGGRSNEEEEQTGGQHLLDDTLKARPVQPVPPLNGESSSSLPLTPTLGSPTGENLTPNDPSNLSSGVIPPDFLRQMFYTLGDYRDILVGKTPNGIDEVIVSSSDKDKEGESDMQKIKQAIDDYLKKQSVDSKTASVRPQNRGNRSPSNSVTSPNPSDTKDPTQLRAEWWTDHAPDIWNGMICALTYEDTEEKGGTPTKIKTADSTDLFEKLKNGNDYNSVKLEQNSDTEALASDASRDAPHNSTANGSTTLAEFVTRPAYFRWLEEWGETFCRERAKRLEEVEKGCMEDGNGGKKIQKCSCDGENCKEILSQDYNTISNFNCPSCENSCRSYKKWIKGKKTEYEKQSNAYNGQKGNYVNGSKGARSGNEFYTKLSTWPNAAAFLQRLGPCKNNENGKGTINFDDKDKTFEHTKDCGPCPIFGVKCKNDNCSDNNVEKCQNTKITADNIKNKTDGNEIVMRVSDNSKNGNGFNDLTECDGAGIFKSIRKDQWICDKFCESDVCGLKNADGSIDQKQIILIRELLKRWVEYFLEDYNKIRKQLKPCMKTDKESACQNKCQKRCECVEQWIEKKRAEWETIRKRYVDQYKNEDTEDYKVKHFLQQGIFNDEVLKAIKPCTELRNFEESTHCNGTENSKKKGEHYDLVLCLLDRLQEKAEKCKENHQNSGEKTQTACDTPPNVEDDEEPFEEENQNPENKVKAPNICPETKDETKEEEEETCTPATVTPAGPKGDKGDEDEKKDNADSQPEEPAGEDSKETNPQSEGNPEQTPVLKPEEEAPAPETPSTGGDKKKDKKPSQPIPRVVPQNPQIVDKTPALATSTLAWSVGIGFVALTYWLLKKKTKRPVDLFSVLEIPQNDYGIPTFKSKNRYIPYKSAQYRGKRYIYIEGDSSGDEKYAFMSDTTDITSSESEYEEMDINDIYAPGSPKYKTLIEVVLEPSKRDIQNDIPSDNTSTNKLTDNEWNQLKHDFISNMLQNIQPNDYTSGNSPTNTHPTTSHHNMDQKPFIMSIHDRNLLSGEEYNYDMTTNSGNNDLYSGQNNLYSGVDPTSNKNGPYSGIDLINDSLNSGNQPIDIYDEMLKRKENELFGTEHPKNTSNNSVSKPTNSDPIMNQLDLFHKWLERHRDMCEKWDKGKKEELLDKLKEKWENERHSGNIHPSDNNINSDNIRSDTTPSSKKMLNSDVSIQIHMDNPKPINQFTNMDTILEDLDKTYNEPYYDVQDDIYYDVNDDKTSVDHINMDYNKMDSNNMEEPTEIQIELDVNNHKVVKEKYPIGDVWDI